MLMLNPNKILILGIIITVLSTGCSLFQGETDKTPAITQVTPVQVPTQLVTQTPALESRTVKGIFIEGESGGDAETLNYILAGDASSHSYAGQTLDSLATFDNEYNVVLRLLAKDIEVSPDGLTYTITIRDDLVWTGGIKITAEDFVYTLKNLMFSDWLNYTYASDWQEEIDGKNEFVEVAVVNPHVFTITRKSVHPDFIYDLYSLVPYPKHIAVKYEGDVTAFTQAEEFNNLTYTGNLGPYKFEEWIRNDKYVVVRNPDYYLAQSGTDKGSPFFEKYIIKLFGTPATRQAALEAGDITTTGIEPQNVAKFQKTPGIQVITRPTTGYSLMLYNMRANGWEGLNNKKIRQAISMSVSKDQLIQSVLLGFGDPAFSFIPGPSPWYSEEGLHKYGVGSLYDKEKAKQILREAGYRTSIDSKEGKPVKLTLVTSTGSNLSEDLALLVKQELADIGIEVDVKLVPWPTMLGNYVRNKVPGSDQEPAFNNGKNAVSQEKWDLAIMALTTNPQAPSGSGIFFMSDGGLNFWGYSNPVVDDLFRRSRTKEALDQEKRKGIYQELASLLSDEQPAEFFAYQKGISGFQKNVKGIEPGIRMGYNYHMWYFE